MTNHTPGPWQIQNGAWGIYVFTENLEAERPYKMITNFINPSETEKANAKLIAAAPDMLEALQATLNQMDIVFEEFKQIMHVPKRSPEGQAIYDQVKAAIEKATI